MRPPEPAEYSRAEGRGATDVGPPAAQAGYGQPAQAGYGQQAQPGYGPAEGRRAGAEAYGEPGVSHRSDAPRRHYYGMAGTLMVLSGLLTFFIGIVGLVRGIFFNRVATYPFYYSTRSRGVTFIVIGAVAVIVGLALLIHMYWARHVATVVAVLSALANFMFLPFYPFWSIVVLTLNVLIIWELTRDRVESRRREFVRLARPSGLRCSGRVPQRGREPVIDPDVLRSATFPSRMRQGTPSPRGADACRLDGTLPVPPPGESGSDQAAEQRAAAHDGRTCFSSRATLRCYLLPAL